MGPFRTGTLQMLIQPTDHLVDSGRQRASPHCVNEYRGILRKLPLSERPDC